MEDGQKTVADALAEVVVEAAMDRERELDEEISRLDNMKEDDLEELRRKRLEQMQKTHRDRKAKIAIGHGEYHLIDEKDFFKVSKESEFIVAHFWRPSTWRCEVMDKHLRSLCQKHWGCRFIKVDAEKSQWLSERLHIWCLPSLVLCKNGKTDHTIVGFSEFQRGDEATTEDVEELLAKWGMISIED